MLRTKVLKGLAVARKSKLFSSTRSNLSQYEALLHQHPIATKAVTSGIIAGSGDLTCQLIIGDAWSQEPEDAIQKIAHILNHPPPHPDWLRLAKFTLVGSVLVGPTLHHWYGFLVRRLPGRNPQQIVRRLFLDQLVFSPVFTGAFFSSIMLLDGSPGKIKQKLEQDYWPTLVSNWALWIPAQLVNFRYIPLHFQVLFSNGTGFFWNIYLSARSFHELDGNSKHDAKVPADARVSAKSALESPIRQDEGETEAVEQSDILKGEATGMEIRELDTTAAASPGSDEAVTVHTASSSVELSIIPTIEPATDSTVEPSPSAEPQRETDVSGELSTIEPVTVSAGETLPSTAVEPQREAVALEVSLGDERANEVAQPEVTHSAMDDEGKSLIEETSQLERENEAGEFGEVAAEPELVSSGITELDGAGAAQLDAEVG
ncbi:unnamed protein product [Chrysoparadoxa australica]